VFSSRRRHTRLVSDWSSDVCSSDLRKPEQTAEILRGEWYYSGDVVSRDADGYLWFKGRADDLIKASGYRISPFEVESCLVSHPRSEERRVGKGGKTRGARERGREKE